MLTTIAVILLILWLLGLVTSSTMGGFIHVLLVIAIALAGGMCCPGTPYAGSLDEDAPSPRPKTLLEWMLGSSWRHDANESGREDRVDPDRPHFPEASTTVGKGRVVLESGYTFTEKGSRSVAAHRHVRRLVRVPHRSELP